LPEITGAEQLQNSRAVEPRRDAVCFQCLGMPDDNVGDAVPQLPFFNDL
jgi:hypothetical protein